ncbi:MAG: tetratricopeptide repeat protein [Lysobacterales bacterium]
MKTQFFYLIAIVLLGGCALQPAFDEDAAIGERSAQDVLERSPLAGLSPDVDFSNFDLLEMSPEMIEFAERAVGSSNARSERLRRLAFAIMRSGDFSLDYEDTTGTAVETFESRRGNCMAFTNMFVAMARYLDIDARYQEVDVPPTWSMSGDSFLYSQHINVHVDLKQGRWREVDFNIYDFDHELETRIIPDSRARAHYFNNIGAERMLADETGPAYGFFRQSLREDEEFASAWINMGILHRREGLNDLAEAAFLEALRVGGADTLDMTRYTGDIGWMSSRQSDTDLIAMSNLANLYEEMGYTDLAAQYFERVHAHRMKNPYYRYQVAESAFEEGDYESAIENLQYAIRRRKNEDEFYYLLSLSYLMKGDREEARTWMKKAEEVAAENSEKDKYSYKLDLLRNLDKD